jgi:hypothetical protein
MDPAITDAILAYICSADVPTTLLQAVALVCKRWARAVAQARDHLVCRYIAETFPWMAIDALHEAMSDAFDYPLPDVYECTLYSTPLLTITFDTSTRPRPRKQECLWYVTIYKFDPVAQIFMQMTIAPQNVGIFIDYLRYGDVLLGQHLDLTIATQSALVNAFALSYARTRMELRRTQTLPGTDITRYGFAETTPCPYTQYIIDHMDAILRALAEPNVDLGRRLPGLIQ